MLIRNILCPKVAYPGGQEQSTGPQSICETVSEDLLILLLTDFITAEMKCMHMTHQFCEVHFTAASAKAEL